MLIDYHLFIVNLEQKGTMVEIKYDKAWFIQSREGNIKEQYFFEKKLGSGGYGAVYLAKNKQTGK